MLGWATRSHPENRVMGAAAIKTFCVVASAGFKATAKTLVCLIFVVAAAPVAANTYLVGPTRQYLNLNAVAGLVNPGDLVLVDGNQTYPSALLTRSGTQALPITIRGVRINGNRPILSGGANTIEVQSNWTVVESFEFTG